MTGMPSKDVLINPSRKTPAMPDSAPRSKFLRELRSMLSKPQSYAVALQHALNLVLDPTTGIRYQLAILRTNYAGVLFRSWTSGTCQHTACISQTTRPDTGSSFPCTWAEAAAMPYGQWDDRVARSAP